MLQSIMFFSCLHTLFSGGSNTKIWKTCLVSLLSLNLGMSIFTAVKILMPQEMFLIELDFSPGNFVFYSLVSLISIFVVNWAGSYMSQFKLTLFYVTLMIFISSMLLLTMSGSLFLIFIGWEGLGVSSFLLIMMYQNWMSAKGALLTLLTNRLGDSVLMVVFCYWVSILMKTPQLMDIMYLLFLLSLVSITKSAQWPFVNWLPAAMAAPTPVSALVHSSTLVTAGIWLLIRFSINTPLLSSMWLLLGLSTLTIASTSALSEKDGKKVVALSTLSQLGMMFISMSLGNKFICLFHVLTHAMAKANLFMVVGELLHKSFSQQDTRHMLSSALTKPLMMCMSISVLSLLGFLFSSGFFSKEQILMGQYSYMSSCLTWILIVIVSSLTLSYCVKLMLMLSEMNLASLISSTSYSKLSMISIFTISGGVVSMGWGFSLNIGVYSLMSLSLQGWYWLLATLGLTLLMISLRIEVLMSMGFWLQGKSVNLKFLESLPLTKLVFSSIEGPSSEPLYLVFSLHSSSVMKHFMRVILILSCFMLLTLGV